MAKTPEHPETYVRRGERELTDAKRLQKRNPTAFLLIAIVGIAGLSFLAYQKLAPSKQKPAPVNSLAVSNLTMGGGSVALVNGANNVTVNQGVTTSTQLQAPPSGKFTVSCRLVDQRSTLHIKGRTVQWLNHEQDVPGKKSYPTLINDFEWYPKWPDGLEYGYRGKAWSDIGKLPDPLFPDSKLEVECFNVQGCKITASSPEPGHVEIDFLHPDAGQADASVMVRWEVVK